METYEIILLVVAVAVGMLLMWDIIKTGFNLYHECRTQINKTYLHATTNELPPSKILPDIFPPATGWHNVLVLKEPHDGDTVLVGFIVPVIARLAKIDAPELKSGADGENARKALTEKLVVNSVYRVWASGRERYGRTLMEFYDDVGNSINKWMIDNNFAKTYETKSGAN